MKKLSPSAYFLVGSMLFGLFFGAGNLIFPVHIGQEAGSQVLPATIGFVLTATGLPFLGVLAIGISDCGGLLGLASRVSRIWGYFFTITLYLTIGPFFAHPRTATVAYEIGFSLYMPQHYQKTGLLVFTILFFSASLFFALRPGKLLIWIGKVLNPMFLLCLSVLIFISFLYPMGSIADAPVYADYEQKAFFKGFTGGYQTMDALAALAFGILVVDALKRLGVTQPKEIAVSTAKAGFISVLLMVIIYTCLTCLGAMSTGKLELSENGGIALAQISHYYFGASGAILLAFIVTLACLKTAIGLTTSCAAAFAEMFPNLLSYRVYAVFFSVLSCIIANAGLSQIITLSLPVLMFLYPPAMVLILLALFSRLFADNRLVYLTTTIATILFSIGDALAVSPYGIRHYPPVQKLLAFYETMPLFGIGMAWVLPAAAGFSIGLLMHILYSIKRNSRNTAI